MSYFGCSHITKRYDGKPVVEDISLWVERGQLVSLLGTSGVGKTTLMQILAGVDKPDTGVVQLDGQDLTGIPGKVSYMLQKDLLLPYKSIVDNVSLPLQLKGTAKKQAHSRALEFFPVFGLEGHEEKYPHQLSGGMRQRAALLRTYLTGNPVMLLDEPFSALDASTKGQMHRWYLEIMDTLQATTLFITHDIDEALLLSDTIYIMAGIPGRIALEIKVDAPKPRPADFLISEIFLREKRKILVAIDDGN